MDNNKNVEFEEPIKSIGGQVYIGRMGKATKVITFKENEFEKKLAPDNAIIEHVKINNEKYVRMTY
ncbi:hypothetical protein ACIQZG_22160 [Lysinibacillus sp. NPDC096418]|uniref:hypothetical protein n=1 Tax=Lysinibacillus sp. NPDC096418 TaxID=3364138 RepID=UPI0037FFADA3